jgi:hypothetical protein
MYTFFCYISIYSENYECGIMRYYIERPGDQYQLTTSVTAENQCRLFDTTTIGQLWCALATSAGTCDGPDHSIPDLQVNV